MSSLPRTMAVIGFGVIGTELGLAIHKLGVDVIGFTSGKSMGGLTDPTLQEYVIDKVSQEMKVHFNGADIVGESDGGRLLIKADDKTYEVEKALVSIGRTANVSKLGLDRLDLKLNKFGVPEVDPSTMKLKDLPHVFLPGDVNAARPLLHEAADEGIIAGHNAVFPEECFKRRIPLGITFSEPNIATVGLRYQQLVDEGVNFVVGEVSFEGQGRSIVKLKEQGLLHVYADKKDGKLLGAEMYGPDGEHLAHLLAWAMSVQLTAREALTMPFYHPTVEEGLRTALRNCAKQLEGHKSNELFRCADPPIR